MNYRSFCKSCGAPSDDAVAGKCSYCKTQAEPRMQVLFGFAVVRPEHAVKIVSTEEVSVC